ncbi:MAG: UDP-3-O-(3-hydroxymyristoyl)glucosamine N-acyltransferase, partial [Planctomycetota bacterium]
GTVIIEDDVEIGANVAIDRARFKATVIESNVKIDNQVHIAHNCRLGASSMFLAQSAVAGSTNVGRRVIVAGQAGIGGHLEIGDGARVGAGSAVFRHIPAGQDYWGSPAGPKTQTIRRIKALDRIDTLVAELRDLRRRMADLEEDQP